MFVDDVGNLSKQFSPDEAGFVKNWLIAGPFPNLGGKYTCKGWDYDFLKESGGEQACVAKIDDSFKSFQTEDIIDKNLIGFSDLANSGMLQKEYVTSWKARESKDKFVNMGSMYAYHTYVVSYAFCNIKVDEEKELWLGLGSDDGAKVWLNHEEVLNTHSHRAAKVD